jgi:hypothetical protein
MSKQTEGERWHETECVGCFAIGLGMGTMIGARTLTALIASVIVIGIGGFLMHHASRRRAALTAPDQGGGK